MAIQENINLPCFKEIHRPSNEYITEQAWMGMRDAEELGYAEENPNWRVFIDGNKIKTGKRLWFSRSYIVSRPEEAISLAMEDGIIPTKIYGHYRTVRSLDVRLQAKT